MKAEQLQLGLRPRPMYEAADLGVRMTQDSVGSLRRAYLPLALVLIVACGATIELAPWLPSLLLWWLKPWLDRALLHIYARQVFGESTSFAESWSARGRRGWPQALWQLTLGRLSPWRAYSMPVVQLEGQTGAARRQRFKTLGRGHLLTAMMVQSAFASIETILTFGAVSLVVWLTPALHSFDTLKTLFDGELAASLAWYLGYAAAMLFVEPFFVAAGFAMYLNRRVELEAWDIEQDLRHAFAGQ